jgi:hypothetical protein
MQAGTATAVPVFTPKSPARSVKGRGGAKPFPQARKGGRKNVATAARQSPRAATLTSIATTTVPGRHNGRSKEVGRDAAPKSSSRSEDHRDHNRTGRQKGRAKESGHGDKHGHDVTGRRRKRRRSKERQRGRSEKPRSGGGRTKPQLDLAEVKRLLKIGKRLPKDALIESHHWRLPSNPHRKRDRLIERAMLQALTGPGSSEAEQRQAIEQANCTPEAPCRRLMCWLCKHRTWFKRRRKLTGLLDHDVPPIASAG